MFNVGHNSANGNDGVSLVLVLCGVPDGGQKIESVRAVAICQDVGTRAGVAVGVENEWVPRAADTGQPVLPGHFKSSRYGIFDKSAGERICRHFVGPDTVHVFVLLPVVE